MHSVGFLNELRLVMLSSRPVSTWASMHPEAKAAAEVIVVAVVTVV